MAARAAGISGRVTSGFRATGRRVHSMRFRHARHQPPRRIRLTNTGSELAEEVDCYLAGTFLEYCGRHRRPLPGWAWVNRFAHGDLDGIVGLCVAPEHEEQVTADASAVESWRNAQRLVARALLPLVADDPAALSRIQKSTLVSLEDLLIELDAVGQLTTRVLVQTARQALRSSIS
jgi:hypothetical protein